MVALAEVLSLSYGLRLKRSDHYRVHMKEQKKSSQARPQYSNVTKKAAHDAKEETTAARRDGGRALTKLTSVS